MSDILSIAQEIANHPRLVREGAEPFAVEQGENYFYFVVEPGFHYSCIVNTGQKSHRMRSRGAPAIRDHGYGGNRFQAESYGWDLPMHNIANNFSAGKSSLMFFAAPEYFRGLYENYVRVYCWEAMPVMWIKLIKITNKFFTHPFQGKIGYYNAFGHRAFLDTRGAVTRSGHDGIDIQPYLGEGSALDVDMAREVLAVADGKVLDIRDMGSIGKAVWIEHVSGGKIYTVMYLHLEEVFVGTQSKVQKGRTPIGKIHRNERHLHIEIFPHRTTQWSSGYSNGGSGQIDPLQVMFEM